MDRGLHKDPRYNLSLNEIATTLDAETAQENNDHEVNAVVHSLTRFGARYRVDNNDN